MTDVSAPSTRSGHLIGGIEAAAFYPTRGRIRGWKKRGNPQKVPPLWREGTGQPIPTIGKPYTWWEGDGTTGDGLEKLAVAGEAVKKSGRGGDGTDLDGTMVAVVGEAARAEGAVGAIETVHVTLALGGISVEVAVAEEPRRQQRPQPPRPAAVILRSSTSLLTYPPK